THPLYRILHDIPNPEMNSFIMREVMMSHLLLWGNSYSQIIRNGRGDITALYPLMPEKMTVDRGSDGKLYYKYNSDKQGSFVFSKDEVFHIVGLGFDGLIGHSPIAMAKNAIGLSIAAEEYGSSFFSNSGTPSGVLEHPGVLKEPEKVRDAWNKAYGGSGNAHKVAVLEEGMKFNPISINPQEAQFLETRKFQVNEICRIFRVPPHMIADLEKSSFNNIEQQSLDFVTNTIRPWLVRIEQSIFQQLLNESEQEKYFAKFNVDGLLRGDFQSRMNGYAVGRQNGWLSANDIRELEDLNRIPEEEGGDRYLCNGNMVDIRDAGTWAEKEEIHE
ncbi:MAG: phage portal protein, partial [Clostridia bacterium]